MEMKKTSENAINFKLNIRFIFIDGAAHSCLQIYAFFVQNQNMKMKH